MEARAPRICRATSCAWLSGSVFAPSRYLLRSPCSQYSMEMWSHPGLSYQPCDLTKNSEYKQQARHRLAKRQLSENQGFVKDVAGKPKLIYVPCPGRT